jgi:hypothetical protein
LLQDRIGIFGSWQFCTVTAAKAKKHREAGEEAKP